MSQLYQRQFDALIDRPLLQKDAALLADLAQRLNVKIAWQHNTLGNDGSTGWQDGRYRAGDELAAPADDAEPLAVNRLPHQQVRLAA